VPLVKVVFVIRPRGPLIGRSNAATACVNRGCCRLSVTFMPTKRTESALKAGESPGRRIGSALFRSFRAQLLVLILLIVIPAVGIALYGNLQQRATEKSHLRERSLAIADLAAASEQNFIDDTRQLLSTLTQFPFLLLATNESFSRTHLSNLRKLSPDYANFGLIETNGLLFCSAETNAGVDLGDRPYFQNTIASKRFSAGGFQMGRITRESTLNFGYPVLDDQGNLRRVLYASLKLAPLAESIKNMRVPTGGAIELLDRQGTVLARNPDHQIWQGKSLTNYLPASQILGSKGGVFEAQMPHKVSKLYAVTPITDGQSPCLYLVVEAPLAVLFAKANAALFRNFFILAAIALITWLLVHSAARHFFFRPMAKLASAANFLAEGDLRARVGAIGGPTELVQLGGALDDMAENVEKRTAELMESNTALRAEVAERQKAEQRAQEHQEEKKRLEIQFLRAQRMESIGALAGGIAHDLNNALVPVLMGAQMLREEQLKNPDRERLLDLIMSSGTRCTEMVKQILTFARGTQGKIASVAVRHLVIEMGKLIRETFPKSVVLQVRAPAHMWTVAGDPTEIHQVLLNLCVNARDAMPQGGQLRLLAENVQIKQQTPGMTPETEPGPYVMLTVEDTGTGIPHELQTRIFEPFFTTKSPDKGTGLGLSTVVSIVQRHKGFVQIKSELGKGTEFRIFLPATAVQETAGASPNAASLPVGNGELILLADDEQMVIELGKTTLENYGYRVLTAQNGLEAIARFEVHKDQISLVITDTDMPFLDGVSAARAIRKISACVPIVMASATKFDTAFIARNEVGYVGMLGKPFDVEQLLKAVANGLINSKPALEKCHQ
jgi:signal transduction histidine kinase/ActR/RegA family two-component response regulator